MRSGTLKAIASALALVALTAAIAAAHSPHPTNRDQALRDGCQRPAALFNFVLVATPEWVYVNRDPSVRVAEGVSRFSAPTSVDEPGTHSWFDFNSNLVPAPRYRFLIAGTRAGRTNNYAGGEADSAGARGRLHYEWEEGSLPKWAWPGDGDHTKIWGSWIWDCGHWITDGRVTGERTEFHPLNGIAFTRSNPSRARLGEVETDAYVSSDGTYAHANEQCALHMRPQSNGTYGNGFFDCARDPRRFRQKLARSYTFVVPAPPRGAGRLELRTVGRVHRGRVAERIRRTSSGFEVTLIPRSKSMRWGKQYFTRWSGAHVHATRLRVTLVKLLVKHADPDASERGVDPAGEKWAMYVEVNGYWKLVDDWAPSLFAAHDHMVVPLDRTISVTLQPGRRLYLFMMGRECDGPSGVVLFGHFVPKTEPCPFNTTESKIEAHNNDDPGAIFDRYRSVHAALGTHTTNSRATIFYPGTGRVTFFNGVQGNDDYELTYNVTRG